MHEISLGYTIEDYLNGTKVEATTFEDIRQAIAKMLVERKGYPKENIKSKVEISFKIEDKQYKNTVDLVAYSNEGQPVLLIHFGPGHVETYIRQVVSAARLLPDGAAKLAVVTDTKSALLIRVFDREILEDSGYQAIPDWNRLLKIVEECPQYELTPEKRAVEERIFYAYSELSCVCSQEECYTRPT